MLAVGFATSLIAPRASAQDGYLDEYPGAVQLLTRIYDVATQDFKDVQTAFDDPAFLQTVVNVAWKTSLPITNAHIRDELGKADRVAKGCTLHDITVNMAESGQFKAWKDSSGLGISFHLVGNHIDAHCTTPDIVGGVGVGPYGDPHFSVDFDADMKVHINIPAGGQPVAADTAVITVSNSRLHPEDFETSLAWLVNAITDFFAGFNFWGLAEDEINKQQVNFTQDINKGLAPLNKVIGQLAQQGFGDLGNSLDHATHTLSLMMTRSSLVPRGPGVISGVIRWNKAYGHPEFWMRKRTGPAEVWGPTGSIADVALITANVQYLPGDQGDFSGPTTALGDIVVSPLPDTRDEYQVGYKITNLPLNVPIQLLVDDSHNYVRWVAGSDPNSAWQGRFFAQQEAAGGPVTIALAGPAPSPSASSHSTPSLSVRDRARLPGSAVDAPPAAQSRSVRDRALLPGAAVDAPPAAPPAHVSFVKKPRTGLPDAAVDAPPATPAAPVRAELSPAERRALAAQFPAVVLKDSTGKEILGGINFHMVLIAPQK